MYQNVRRTEWRGDISDSSFQTIAAGYIRHHGSSGRSDFSAQIVQCISPTSNAHDFCSSGRKRQCCATAKSRASARDTGYFAA
jgi:hypothetical protein